MTEEEYRERMIELQEERNLLIQHALFPNEIHEASVFQLMIELMNKGNKNTESIVGAICER